jgi:hypothetical protein
MVNYSNGKVYKIVPTVEPKDEGDVYYGSTTKEYLSQRMDGHRRDFKKNEMNARCSSKLLFEKFGVENCVIVLVELVDAKSKDELVAVEAKYIINNLCVNKCVPLRTRKEYNTENKDINNERQKQYYIDNKEAIIEKSKQYYFDNKEAIIEKSKQYYIDNKDTISEYKKQYITDNKEAIIEKSKLYRIKNKDTIREKQNLKRKAEKEQAEALTEN